MKRHILLILFICIYSISWSQRVSTQKFTVRKITYNQSDQVETISGVFVEINKAKFKSDNLGQVTANIPVVNDLGFNISNIYAPGYILSIPENLNERLYLSSNPIIIVLADIEAVKRERERIESANKRIISEYEAKINSEIERNNALLHSLETKDEEYAKVLSELEKVKIQLRSFQNNKIVWQEKIDSIATVLPLIDIQSLSSPEQQRIEAEKSGQVLETLIKEFDTHITIEMKHQIDDFNKYLKAVAQEYEEMYIVDNPAYIIDSFANTYYEYINYRIDITLEQKDRQGLDLIIYDALEEKFYELLCEHINTYKKKWMGMVGDIPKPKYEYHSKSQKEAEAEFILWAMYPQREKLQHDIKGSYQQVWDLSELTKVFYKAHPEFMTACSEIASKYEQQYSTFDNDKILSLKHDDWFHLYYDITEEIRQQNFYRESPIYYEFTNIMMDIVSQDVVNKLKIRNNNLIDTQKYSVYNATLDHLHKSLKPIGEEDRLEYRIEWEESKHLQSEYADYEKLKTEYPEYFAFIEKLVVRFLKPVIDKYNSDDALYVWLSALENDIKTYCWNPFRSHMHLLEHIDGLKGSNDKCFDIVRAIINIEKSKIIKAHNRRYQEIIDTESNRELETIEQLKNSKQSFDSENDIILFLVTHKFVNSDYELTSLYDSTMTKWQINNGYYNIDRYNIIEWNSKYAKLKLYIGGTIVIITISLDGENTTYTESCGGTTNYFRAVDK